MPPLCPIPPFQIMGVDIMALPKTSKGNQYVQDFLLKWPMVYALHDQRTHRIVKILVEEIVPIFRVPEALLSDRATNFFISFDVCAMLGIQKLNTTAYHPQCNGLVERYNRTLKAKHVVRFGN